MNTESWLYNIVLVINAYEIVIGQHIFEDSFDTDNFSKCGNSTLDGTISPQIIDGDVSQIGNFPWHAGLYFRKEKDGEEPWEQKCGGSLITDQFVLTAAHCVYRRDVKDVGVALGKIHRSWDQPEYGQQLRNVSKIIYPYDFQEETYYFDIALLLLDKKVKLGKRIMPVCIGFMGESEDILNKTLFVSGWGQTKNVPSGSPSETLLYTDVKYFPKNTCRLYLPPGFVMFDKFCTIKNNNTELSIVQRGDSGGGLTVVHDKKHYIFGIVSVKLTTSYNSQITLFTNLTWPVHISWIEKEVRKYHSGFRWSSNEKPASGGCVLPNSSPNTRFCSQVNGCDENCTFNKTECLVPPGSSVDIVKVVCAPGYRPPVDTYFPGPDPSSSGVSFCLKSGWYPPIIECKKLCHPLQSEMLLMTCRLGVNIVDCSKPALPGTTVSFVCAPNFSEYQDQRKGGAYSKINTCNSSGMWSGDLPTCKPACGVFKDNASMITPLIVGGQEAYLGYFPWQAGIYFRSEVRGITVWEQRCGGSLVSNRFVLTAAHCLLDANLTDVRVAVGKYYRSWDRYEPSEQKRNVTAISLPPQYNRLVPYFDLALLLLSERIRFGEYVMPVCRDLDQGRDDFYNKELFVAGWGRTSDFGAPSEVLLYNKVTAILNGNCSKRLPPVLLNFDQICVENNNYSESILQAGDSGGGLTVRYKDGLHYLVGISRLKIETISLFTNLKWGGHTDWIALTLRQLENQYVQN